MHHRQPKCGPDSGEDTSFSHLTSEFEARLFASAPHIPKPGTGVGMATISRELTEAFTFDDVLLKPGLSDVLPSEVDVRSRITRSILLNLPIRSSPMDTVTQSTIASAMP